MGIDLADNFKLTDAYWLSPNSDIYPLHYKRHIDFFTNNPALFNVTKEEIEEVYKKYNERLGLEGKAREELFFETIKNGWIRIRNYGNKGWSVQLWEMTKHSKEIIEKWATNALNYKKNDSRTKVYEFDKIIFSFLKNINENKENRMCILESSFDDVVRGNLDNLKGEETDNEAI